MFITSCMMLWTKIEKTNIFQLLVMPLPCSAMQRRRSSMTFMGQRKQAAQVTTEIRTAIMTSLVVMRVSFV